uniref:CSON004040 protein n=1 Tax=Culicoides sonorensis TaxID=179676 RepID=A0A336L592_CULSO
MSQYRRLGKNLDNPRPLNSTAALKQNFYEIQGLDELITLIENVTTTLQNGTINADNLNVLTHNLRIHGVRLEEIAKDTLDRAFVVLRNSSQDERLSIMTRLNLLELIELRAKNWQVSSDINSYYHQSKASNKVETDGLQVQMEPMMLSTSPPLQIGSVGTGPVALGPGELIRNSGKFSKPTKIPGKNYSKDEIVIRNADSGKVMGIKGRRVHMIEELSETIISFQKVNPGAKERLVQITGPSEEKINYAKSLIEDTIRRNASPVRMDSQDDSNGGVLTSGNGFVMGNMIQQPVQAINLTQNALYNQSNQTTPKYVRSNTFGGHGLQQSFSTDDASLGEYKYTVNVGQHSVKITGDNFELIRTAKLVLDDYFSSAEFLQPDNDADHHQFTSNNNMFGYDVLDQFMGLNMSQDVKLREPAKKVDETNDDDEVFIVDENGKEIPVGTKNKNVVKSDSGGSLLKSKKSNNLRYSSSPSENNDSSPLTKSKSIDVAKTNENHVSYEQDELLKYSKSPLAWVLPENWIKICEKWPALVRNKVNPGDNEMNNNSRAARPYFNRHKSFDCATSNTQITNINNNNKYPKHINPTATTNVGTDRLKNFTRSTSLCD